MKGTSGNGKSLVIVESPTKARTIVKFLGKDFIVKASNGHIRDLPNSAKEIPAKVKKEPWARLGVNINNEFEALYVIPAEKKKHVQDLKDSLKEASTLYLATDEDREGESISWHLLETLQPKVPVKRLVFHEITKEAIQEALNSPRSVDENLVRAQETRRIVDRLFGYEVSPLLWKKVLSGLSAGRVQSVAVRLLVERERERIAFQKAQYWGIKGKFDKLTGAQPFEALLTHVGDKRVALGKDFDPDTGRLKDARDTVLLNEEQAKKLQAAVLQSSPVVSSVEEKPYTTRPAPPFVTSTLQVEANTKLRYSPKRAMQIAQQLYENGYITYMRTDSTTLSTQAIAASRALVKQQYGAEYLPAEPRIYKTKVKNAQEAHEAIRPAGESFTPMEVVRAQLGEDAFRLYELIWKRTVASQMSDARGTHISVAIDCGEAKFRAVGKTIEFPGFLRAYVEGADDPDAELADQERVLPKLAEGEKIRVESADATEHWTQPPARYTEGSLIKELEKRGIGRPSTWASVVELVLSRAYAFKKGTALVPTFTAMAVIGLLEGHFPQLVDYTFTARLEDDLDAISLGEAENIKYLRAFYFGNGHKGLKELVETGEKTIDPREVCGVDIGKTASDVPIQVRVGRYGPFLTDGTTRASIPDGLTPEEVTVDIAVKLLADAGKQPEALGMDPVSGDPVYLKVGRFGPYVQLGEMVEGGPKPKMVSLLPGWKPEEVTLEKALRLLELPKTVGKHPESQSPVVVAYGRFGPYIKCGDDTRSIPKDGASPLDFTLEMALALLAEPKTRKRAQKSQVVREIGEHPDSKAKIVIKEGPYGLYVTDGSTNASVPKDSDPQKLPLGEALALIEARAAMGGGKKKKRAPAKSGEKKAAKGGKKKAAKGGAAAEA